MNAKLVWSTLAALAVVLAAGTAQAQEATKDKPQPAVKLTPEEKAAAKAQRKADIADAKAKGETTPNGAATQSPAYKASGTHDTRSAERKANRKKTTEAEKVGEGSKTGDADSTPKK